MKNLRDVLEDLKSQKITVDQAQDLIKLDYLDDLDGLVQLDILRHMRTGIPEVIFAETKSTKLVGEITQKFLDKNRFALLTRLKPSDFDLLKENYSNNAEYIYEPNEDGRVAYVAKNGYQIIQRPGAVGLITAGTSDIPYAEEAKLVLNAIGYKTRSAYDVGIAGFHRIFAPLKRMIEDEVDVIIVFAGMEGTLPGVVSALVDIPVIGVPTSTGYGLGEKGKGALTTMLQSCSPGLAVVNIDSGFSAASMAALIIKRINERVSKQQEASSLK